MKSTQSLLLLALIIIATGAIFVFSGRGETLTNTSAGVIIQQAGGSESAAAPAQPTAPVEDVQLTRPPAQEGIPAESIAPDAYDGPTPAPVNANEIFVPPNPANPNVTNEEIEDWNPPALEVPLARHPWDHYWFIRPVSAKYNNFALQRYPYGSNGPADDMITHHGIDLANNEGVEIYAAASGVVLNAGDGLTNADEPIPSYGNVVAIEHDMGTEGRKLYTLYAHMSVIIAEEGQRVETGDIIGLVGNTGGSTGPHLHFEVRVGRNSYYTVRNPTLWMAPYAGSGTVAGRVELPNGSAAQDVNMWLEDAQTGQVFYRTATYAGYSVASDDNWNENFVFGDVRVGEYIAIADSGGLRWEGRVSVVEGVTNWVEMTIDDDFDPTPEPTATP
jgi:murein DD-endopeptidase MepM/ murein hydrolase activator NlpD